MDPKKNVGQELQFDLDLDYLEAVVEAVVEPVVQPNHSSIDESIDEWLDNEWLDNKCLDNECLVRLPIKIQLRLSEPVFNYIGYLKTLAEHGFLHFAPESFVSITDQANPAKIDFDFDFDSDSNYESDSDSDPDPDTSTKCYFPFEPEPWMKNTSRRDDSPTSVVDMGIYSNKEKIKPPTVTTKAISNTP